MHPQLQHVRSAIESATAGMSDQQMLAAPAGKWCTAEILEHLAITYSTTADRLQKVAASGEARLKPDNLRNRVGRFIVTTLRYIPGGRKAPEFAVPKKLDPAAVRNSIFTDLAALDSALTTCEQRFKSREPIADHPVIGRCTVQQWRTFHEVHSLHHMKQIAALRSTLGSGSAAAQRSSAGD